MNRFAGAPIDFEVVEINASTNTPEDMENALLSVRRNGVALKGIFTKLILVMSMYMKGNLNIFSYSSPVLNLFNLRA